MNEATVDRQLARTESATARTGSGWLVCFAAALSLYALTANRGPQWQDSGDHILRIVTGESINPLGLALTHPLHHWLCRFAAALNLLEPAFAVTLISSLAAAFAVANVYGCVLTLTSDRLVAVLAAISLAIANTFWKLATVTEVIALTAALLSAECWCLIVLMSRAAAGPRSALCADARGLARSNCSITQSSNPQDRSYPCAFLGLFFFNGLGLANHNLALLTTPVLAAIALLALYRRWIAWPHLLLAAAAWLIASLPYTGLVLSEALRSGDLRATMHSALFGISYEKDVLNVSISGSRLLINAAFIALNFPNLLLPAAVYGVFTARRFGVPPLTRWALFVALFIHALFALRYSVPDQHYFFIPMYLLFVIFGGVGFAAWRAKADRGRRLQPAPTASRPPVAGTDLQIPVRERRADVPPYLKSHISNLKSQRGVDDSALSPRRDRIMVAAAILLALTPLLYAFTPALARRFDVLGFVERHKPYRDDYVYLFTPWSVVERSAERMSREAVALAGDDGIIIVEDRLAEFAVRYRAIRDGKTGIEITSEMEPKDLLRIADAGRPIVLVPRSVDEPLTLPLTGSWRRMGDLYILNP